MVTHRTHTDTQSLSQSCIYSRWWRITST